MDPIQKFFRGKKTYIMVGLTILGIIAKNRGVDIPPCVFQILAALGFGTLAAKFQRAIEGERK